MELCNSNSSGAFLLDAGVRFEPEAGLSAPIQNAVSILQRDLAVCAPGRESRGIIRLKRISGLAAEHWRLHVEPEALTLEAGDDMGFVYGLLFLSSQYLGVAPFWFWLEQPLAAGPARRLAPCTVEGPRPCVRWRGWFFNDEVLLTHWAPEGDAGLPWRMAFEALLRCGGNMVIPGTGSEALRHRALAVSMGLALTHHHAEPLGAELFAHAYPGEKAANYDTDAPRFWALWEQGVKDQLALGANVVWTVGFRGQGDRPFWADDTTGKYATPAARGRLIREVIDKQCAIVRKYVKDPVLCTNLYGEVMELYEQGCLALPPEIIRVYADNGYGKMVSRRRDNEQARVSALPRESGVPQGIYYHASFYDLQAAAHITMLSTPASLVCSELDAVLAHGGGDYWLINCSNIRPHCFFLDLIRKKWLGLPITEQLHAEHYAQTYYAASPAAAKALTDYAASTLRYGPHEDDRAGEQFYTENARILAYYFIRRELGCADQLRWLTGGCGLYEQAQKLSALCAQALPGAQAYLEQCRQAAAAVPEPARGVFDRTVVLQAELQCCGMQGLALFAQSLDACRRGDYFAAFVLAGDSAAEYARADELLQTSGQGLWRDFYANDCFADYAHTAYMVRKARGTMRELGDNVRHDTWHRQVLYTPAEQGVYMQLVTERHMTDEQLYQQIKIRQPTAAQ